MRRIRYTKGVRCTRPGVERTKSRAFRLGPRSRPSNEPYNFSCEMAPYVGICYAYSGWPGGVSAQNFVAGRWRDRGKFCGSIACPYWTGLCPYSQKNRRTRDGKIETTTNALSWFLKCSVGGAPRNGLSGEPWLWKVVADFPMFVSCVCVAANEPWSLGTVPWESDSLKQFMGKPRRRWRAP